MKKCTQCGKNFDPRRPSHTLCDTCYWQLPHVQTQHLASRQAPQYRRFKDQLRNPLPAILIVVITLVIATILERCS